MEVLYTLIQGGFNELFDYLSYHVLSCLVPAFFIAGAMAVVLTKGAIIKYFGHKAKKIVSYSVASVSGILLAVCSCTVLPLFGGIYRMGAGLGPAITFLYSGPAINILAISLTGVAIGWHMGAARAIGAVAFAIVIGLIMAIVFSKEEQFREQVDFEIPDEKSEKPISFLAVFFGTLVAILIISTSNIDFWIKAALDIILITVVAYMVKRYFEPGEFRSWMSETWSLAKLVVPMLLIGIFIVGMVTAVLPPEWIANYVGNNSVTANIAASLVGALFYFSTLTEVPIVRGLMDLGMHPGPALALLLAGPAVSIPNLLVVNQILGLRKTGAYFICVVISASITGWIYGTFFV
ncbi:putative membrane protein, YraQ family [Candidatus Syntrophocurvum alkaliphilum]|uniref:Putative membrane protein, YraQ family n=1 Tax=Candidatus Syntrophocurvum alkaliphilum TaxID=2293317 RepID=A0A6I6DD93_9FIRM|nr:permease [Candidatus Syntrophocurvum alkaliphilum]QGU00140.1 putative membrane protein, YraQ family [Candidatus Syntrophocurvum alkaliphilum]